MVVVRESLRIHQSLVRLVEMGNQVVRHGYSSHQAVELYGLRRADQRGDLPVHGVDSVPGTVQRVQHLPWWWISSLQLGYL